MTTVNESEVTARIDELLARPYRKVISGNADEGYLAEVAELPGCVTAGETEVEALELLRDAMAGWFESRLAHGLPIPDPDDERHYSGRVLVRMPPQLHRRLVGQAREQGVSLNQWVVSLLAQEAGAWLTRPR